MNIWRRCGGRADPREIGLQCLELFKCMFVEADSQSSVLQ